jgi:ABC-type phosphate transport system substrate-binding protein
MLSCCLTESVEAVEVITNNSVEQSSLTTLQLRRIFTMRQTYWANNNGITIFVLPSQHALHKKFSKELLEIYPYQLERIWNKLTYSGLGVAPTVVDSPEALIQAVVETPGSIGYADKKTLAPFIDKKVQDTEIKKAEGSVTEPKGTVEKNIDKGVVHVVNIKD